MVIWYLMFCQTNILLFMRIVVPCVKNNSPVVAGELYDATVSFARRWYPTMLVVESSPPSELENTSRKFTKTLYSHIGWHVSMILFHNVI